MPFVSRLGNGVPVAWSADGRSLYFTRRAGPGRPVTLCRWCDGPTEPVAPLGTADDVLMVRTSPGGRWVAVLCSPPGTIEHSDATPSTGMRLLAVRLPDGATRRVTATAGAGACFTGPDRLAFVRADDDGHGHPTGTGQVVEANLSAAPPADPTPVADVLPAATGEVEPVPDGLLFLATPRSFPLAPPADPNRPDLTLFHRVTGRLAPVAGHLLYQVPSPDGTRVLTVEADTDVHLVVAVRRLDGSARQVVRDVPDMKWSLLPVWHGSDRVTFQSAVGTDRVGGNATRTVFDLVDLSLPAGGRPGDPRVPSHGWPDAMRPAFRCTNWPKVTDAPATRPAAVQFPR